MPLYHLLLDTILFHTRIRPALAASWQQRSFEPCRSLCESLLPAARAFAERYHLGLEEPLLAEILRGLPFDREFWHHLAGELLWYGAKEIPEIETAPDTLCCLLAPDRYRDRSGGRERFAPIEQVHFGARDVLFGGGFYRPEHAGYNDSSDVSRLADYLHSLDPEEWTTAQLADLEGEEEDRADELEFVREWFPALRDLYDRARADRVIFCEIL
jgi:hypothetical protein